MSESFEMQVRRFVTKSQAQADVLVQRIVAEIIQRLTHQSPVDTGRFRGNWRVSPDRPDLSVPFEPRGKGERPNVTGLLSPVIKGLHASGIVWVTNNVSYAVPLAHGHSPQAPSGWVKVTVSQVADMIAEILRHGHRS